MVISPFNSPLIALLMVMMIELFGDELDGELFPLSFTKESPNLSGEYRLLPPISNSDPLGEAHSG